jgi:hypothetical protein
MFSYREFEAGPDPFGRNFHVYLKWLQTAISIRHADTVDVCFVLTDESGARTGKTIALPHADLLRVSRETGRSLDDPWCGRIAALHLRYLVETGEDMEKDLVTMLPADLQRYAAELAKLEGAPAGARR